MQWALHDLNLTLFYSQSVRTLGVVGSAVMACLEAGNVEGHMADVAKASHLGLTEVSDVSDVEL
jgi:hypothetical protein